MKQILPSRTQSGFTLIELLIVFSVIVILSSSSIAAFVSYSQIQSVNAFTNEFVTTLYSARSRSVSQVKPEASVCLDPATLDGYKVIVCPSGCSASKSYELRYVCDGNDGPPIVSRIMPNSMEFSPTNRQVFFFKVLSGMVENAAANGTAITISGYNNSTNKVVTVYADGRISVQ